MRTVSPTLFERDNLYDYRVSFRYFGTFQIVNVTYEDTKTDKNKNQLLSRHGIPGFRRNSLFLAS